MKTPVIDLSAISTYTSLWDEYYRLLRKDWIEDGVLYSPPFPIAVISRWK